MFKVIITIFLLFMPLTSFAQTVILPQIDMKIPSGNLTLSEALQLALKASPDVKQAAARIEAAQAVVDQARSAFKPMVSAHLGKSYLKSRIHPDWDPSTHFSDSYEVWTAGIEANWLLFDGFTSRARMLAAEHQAEASEKTREETRRLLAEAVSSVFYQAQLTVESMVIAQQNSNFNRILEEEADIRWQAGSIPEAEKLNFSLRALQAESDYLRAEQNFKLVTTVLAELMALPDAKLPEELYPTHSEKTVLATQIPDYTTEFSYAMQQRPDLQALDASIAALQQSKKVQQGRYWPKLILNSGFDYTKIEELKGYDQKEHDAYAGLHLTWDIYQGGSRPAKVREAEHEISALRQQKQRQVLSIQSAIRQAIASAEATLAMYQRQQQSLLLTAKIRDHVEKAYRAGVANLTRLNEAQTDLVRASGAEAASRINYLMALQQLKAVSGRILEF
ncbi:Outer membrane protein TolC [Desulfuromusa kysingii]|uniref:Outer membrane protein TolC n=1 Tax=Desulfuromusa kysingii TaxID=37625 RepID=A0A1H4ATI6_9BACT|nr:TolC family protein [Desulfuromusa kysingii]SEA39209.1 Outer membrane protein TolC [Desulfuromusa kysingii]